MIYRILTGTSVEYWDTARETYGSRPAPMRGAGTTLGEMTWELHLPGSDLTNPREHFWVTERGGDRFGRILASDGRRFGYLVKVICRKNPRRSQIVYADTWPMAILPDTRKPRQRE